MLQDVMETHDGKNWMGFPSPAKEPAVLNWLKMFQETALLKASHALRTTEHANQLDVFFTKRTNATTSAYQPLHYGNVLVIGELKPTASPGRFKADFLQLARCARSVFTEQPTRRFLHRDISTNSIIITDPTVAGGFSSMLIDLDLAKFQDSESSGARQITGTMQFMAIEVLRGSAHTYRHDLESFFYVLLWLCARQSWRNLSATDTMKTGSTTSNPRGSFDHVAEVKENHMHPNGLQRIMNEFPPALEAVKLLCKELRGILFPHDAEHFMQIGTPSGNPDRLYSRIIKAFDDAIKFSE